jgi:hypothetical protein
MADLEATIEQVATATDWNARVALIRRVPEHFGKSAHQRIYAAIAQRAYVPNLAPDFAYVHWREDYELPSVDAAYRRAYEMTKGFSATGPAGLAAVIEEEPTTLLIFRLLLGFTAQEFAAATEVVAERHGVPGLASSRVKSIEGGRRTTAEAARSCAYVIDEGMRGVLFGPAGSAAVQPKIRKPDTAQGWRTVRRFAAEGVPLQLFLHQRHYGGAFRQLLDATSARRGDLLEDAVEALFTEVRVQFIRTGSHNQDEITGRFGVTVRPAPDFVVYDGADTLRALLECKGANDGGTARDKAARYATLRGESQRLGGVPLFAVLAGLGWKRTADALGPVVRDTDGRVFTLPTLREMLEVQPFPTLVTGELSR